MKCFIPSMILILGFASRVEAKPRIQKGLHPYSVRLQIETLYLHVGDPDWDHIWKRRGWIPQVQVGCKNYFLKARFFTLGKYDMHLDRDWGVRNFIFNNFDNIENGITWSRSYKTFDLIPSIAIIHTKAHEIQLGIGTTHRRGSDMVEVNIPNSTAPDVDSSVQHNWNQWGAIAEVSYVASFLKYGVASFDIGFRVYPQSTSLFTIGIGLGLQYKHQ